MENRILKRPEIATVKQGTTIVKNTKIDNPLINNTAIEFLNYRIEQEEYSSRIYLAMSMWLNNEGFSGASSLWKKYSGEELTHSDWARTYLLSFGIQPLTPALDSSTPSPL